VRKERRAKEKRGRREEIIRPVSSFSSLISFPIHINSSRLSSESPFSLPLSKAGGKRSLQRGKERREPLDLLILSLSSSLSSLFLLPEPSALHCPSYTQFSQKELQMLILSCLTCQEAWWIKELQTRRERRDLPLSLFSRE